uniref:Cytochrome aa3 subunit 2 n=1 Tax=Anaerolinea thermolimosa TaxID=229919 RepID=A0A7C4KHV6_9CHLR
MKRPEFLARLIITAALVGVVALPVWAWTQTPLIHASIAENGGWSPDVIQARVGEPLHLKFTSNDVMHGFAVGQMEMQPVDIEPGKVSETTLIFAKPGIYTFFCTRWCGLNHWRMRGTIEVSGEPTAPQPVTAPLYVTLGLNLDVPHLADAVPAEKPSAIDGLAQLSGLPVDQSPEYYRSHSPAQVFQELSSSGLTDSQRWDVVAAIWAQNTSPAALAAGQKLYVQNCAACHGETGSGNGVFADELAASGESSMQTMNGSMAMSMQTPANFSDPQRMLGASPALLQGKILRGGMGTGMPMWGSIFTDEQIWNVIAFLYTFQFDYSK